MRESKLCDKISNVISFRAIFFQEFQPSRNIVENISYYKSCSIGAAALFADFFFCTLDSIMCTIAVFTTFCHYINFCDSTNRSQRFTSETKCHYAVKVILLRYFTGSMTKKSDGQIIRCYALAVVRHSHICSAAVFDLNSYYSRTGIYGVFKKFLNNRSRTVNYLASCYKLGNFPA